MRSTVSVVAAQIQKSAAEAFKNFLRSLSPIDFTKADWVSDTASLSLLRSSGQKISITSRLDVARVLPLALGDSKKYHKMMRECKYNNLATAWHHEGLVHFSHEALNSTLKDSLKHRKQIIFTHSSSPVHILQILEDKKLKESSVMRGGAASQPGIFASTDLEGKSIRDALLKMLGTNMIFFSANCDQLTLASSAYAYSDRTTVKAYDELGISPISMYVNNQLIILDKLAFCQMQIGGLVTNFLREHYEAIQLAATILKLSEDSLYDSTGKSYNLEDFQCLNLAEKIDILRNTILSLAETHDIHRIPYFKTGFCEYEEQVDAYEKSLRFCFELCENNPSLKEAVSQFPGLMESIASTISRPIELESKPRHP